MIRVVDAAGNLLADAGDKRVRDIVASYGYWPDLDIDIAGMWALFEFCGPGHEHDGLRCRTCGNRVERG